MDAASETRSSWSWPDKTATTSTSEEASLPGSFTDEAPDIQREQASQDTDATEAAPKPQRHYPPRTCRICLEIILPSFEPAPEGLASMFTPTPSVSYISSEPESGRLIRPCKCSGSSRYVHEGCLQSWRHSDPDYSRRTYWECPTCKFRYRLERMRWARWISSPILQVLLTVVILFTTIFVFGFIADPIINLYLDPYDTITSIPLVGSSSTPFEDDDPASWAEHFLKGLASLGMLGFVKAFFMMSPYHFIRLGQGGGIGAGRGRGNNGRDRLENISWHLVAIGLLTFLYAVWTWVRAWSKKTMEKVGERVADVQGDDDDFEEESLKKDSSTTTAPDLGKSTAYQRHQAHEPIKDL